MVDTSTLASGQFEDSNSLYKVAFNNSFQPNIIFSVDSGRILSVNKAACTLLGYSKKVLLTKSRSDILDVKEKSFVRMLKQRKTEGQSSAIVTAIRKNGNVVRCEISSAVFVDEDGIEKAISTIVDTSLYEVRQKDIDIRKEKIVTDNILSAKTKQRVLEQGKGCVLKIMFPLSEQVMRDKFG